MSNILDRLFFRGDHVCSWWCCFTFDNPVRKLLQDPKKILGSYVRSGDTVIDVGPGQGYFTVPLCRFVGDQGRVFAVDVQEKMLRSVSRRAQRARVQKPLQPILSDGKYFGVAEKADFILAFWMVHEVPDKKLFMAEIMNHLKPGGKFLLAEPKMHVNSPQFEKTVFTAREAGLKLLERPIIFFSRAVLFSK